MFLQKYIYLYTHGHDKKNALCIDRVGNIFHVNILSKYFNHWVLIEVDGKIVEKVYNLHNLGNLVSYEEKDITIKIQTNNKMNGIIEQYFGNCFTTDIKLRVHNIISKRALLLGGETFDHKKER